MSLVYRCIETVQSKKSFLKFDCWSNKAFKKYFLNTLFVQPSNIPWLNHFYAHINKRHLGKTGGYSGRNVLFRLTTIKKRRTVRKITSKMINFQFRKQEKNRKELDLANMVRNAFAQSSVSSKEFHSANIRNSDFKSHRESTLTRLDISLDIIILLYKVFNFTYVFI